jgi:hypothetical protein
MNHNQLDSFNMWGISRGLSIGVQIKVVALVAAAGGGGTVVSIGGKVF